MRILYKAAEATRKLNGKILEQFFESGKKIIRTDGWRWSRYFHAFAIASTAKMEEKNTMAGVSSRV